MARRGGNHPGRGRNLKWRFDVSILPEEAGLVNPVEVELPSRKGYKVGKAAILSCLPEFGEVLVRIDIDYKSHYYWTARVPSDFGEAFRLENRYSPEKTIYHVLFQSEQDCSCECRGFLRWGHCKHTDALRAFRAAGVI